MSADQRDFRLLQIDGMIDQLHKRGRADGLPDRPDHHATFWQLAESAELLAELLREEAELREKNGESLAAWRYSPATRE